MLGLSCKKPKEILSMQIVSCQKAGNTLHYMSIETVNIFIPFDFSISSLSRLYVHNNVICAEIDITAQQKDGQVMHKK